MCLNNYDYYLSLKGEQIDKAEDMTEQAGEAELARYWNRDFSSVNTPPFSLPEGSPKIDDGRYRYTYDSVSRSEYDSFLLDLQDKGFSFVEMKYSAFLFRDDCMVFSVYVESEGYLSLSWYQKSPFAPREGIGYEEAASLFSPGEEDSLSKIAIHPIDVTPEGFYERTGGQIFAVPSYSYDGFRKVGAEELMVEENEHYDCAVYYVKGDVVLEAGMECVATCDMDGDGGEDVLLLSFGPTSGLFTFDVTIVTEDGIYDSIFNTNFGVLGFSSKDGRIVLESVGYDEAKRIYDIAIEDRNNEKIVKLYDKGEALEIWGVPNSRNGTVLPEAEG